MKANTPSSALGAIMLQAIVAPASSPNALASSAEMKSPVTSISNAAFRGTLRDSATPGVAQPLDRQHHRGALAEELLVVVQ